MSFINSDEEILRTNNFEYISTLVLLDNKIVAVAKDGIHFFDEEFINENNSKFINFTEPLEKDKIETVFLSQFSIENDGYILILCKGIVYIFDKEKNFIKNISIEDSISKVINNLISYKK